MQLKVSLPVANFLIPKPFPFAGAKFTPPTQEHADKNISTNALDAVSILPFNNLSTAITALSGVKLSDFDAVTVVSFNLSLEFPHYPKPNRQDDQRLLTEAISRAEAILDLIRVGYCRLDIPQYSPMMAGYFSHLNRLAVAVHNDANGNQRLIAREPDRPIMMPGLGLELDSVPSCPVIEPIISEQHADESLGARLQRLLRVFGQTFTAFSDDEKILNLIFALEGLLTPENCSTSKFKTTIGKFLSDDSRHQKCENDTFAKFYKEVRNPMVHRGKSYEQLGRDRKTDLMYLQGIVAKLLERLSKYRRSDFSEFWRQYV